MMNNKRLLPLFVCLLAWMIAPAQGLRHSVCVVYPEYSQADSMQMAVYARQIGRMNRVSDARALTAYTEGTFGSGVLVKTDAEGELLKKYVLTNRHVVGYAATARLVFMLHEGTIELPHCEVIGTSPTADLALIRIPDTLSALVPLAISSLPISEGEDIAAAGFPRLNNDPSWQLTRGTVSNSALRIDGNSVSFVQHTAPIDPGSSGGPLLRKQNGVYEVVGINTLKAFYRDRVGMAIPSEDIRTFLTTDTASKHDQHTLARLADFPAELLSDLYRSLPDTTQQRLRQQETILPLDIVDAVVAAAGGTDNLSASIEQAQKQVDKRENGFAIEAYEHSNRLFVEYDYLVPFEHSASLIYQYSSTYGVYGASFSYNNLPPVECPDVACYAFSGGFQVGAQLPMRLRKNQYLTPSLIFGLNVGMIHGTGTSVFWQIPLHLMFDYQYEWNKVGIVVGAGYAVREVVSPVGLQHPNFFGMAYFMHGPAIRLGLAF